MRKKAKSKPSLNKSSQDDIDNQQEQKISQKVPTKMEPNDVDFSDSLTIEKAVIRPTELKIEPTTNLFTSNEDNSMNSQATLPLTGVDATAFLTLMSTGSSTIPSAVFCGESNVSNSNEILKNFESTLKTIIPTANNQALLATQSSESLFPNQLAQFQSGSLLNNNTIPVAGTHSVSLNLDQLLLPTIVLNNPQLQLQQSNNAVLESLRINLANSLNVFNTNQQLVSNNNNNNNNQSLNIRPALVPHTAAIINHLSTVSAVTAISTPIPIMPQPPKNNVDNTISDICDIFDGASNSLGGESSFKIEKKRERNRYAARKCREKKIKLITELENHKSNALEENYSLKQKLKFCERQVTELSNVVKEHMQCGCKLPALPFVQTSTTTTTAILDDKCK